MPRSVFTQRKLINNKQQIKVCCGKYTHIRIKHRLFVKWANHPKLDLTARAAAAVWVCLSVRACIWVWLQMEIRLNLHLFEHKSGLNMCTIKYLNRFEKIGIRCSPLTQTTSSLTLIINSLSLYRSFARNLNQMRPGTAQRNRLFWSFSRIYRCWGWNKNWLCCHYTQAERERASARAHVWRWFVGIECLWCLYQVQFNHLEFII